MTRSDYPYSHSLRVRFGEVDYQGIVFNANYLAYFDVALTEYLRAAGLVYAADFAERDRFDWHVVKVTMELKQPARADDMLDVCVKIGRFGRSSLTWDLAIFRPGIEEPVTVCEIIWVYTDQQTHLSAEIPEAMRDKLSAVGDAG